MKAVAMLSLSLLLVARAGPGYGAQAGQDLSTAQKAAAAEVNGTVSPIPAAQRDVAARNVFEHLTAQRDSGTVSRDESMADNVGWLLDQAPPDSKIVLWALARILHAPRG